GNGLVINTAALAEAAGHFMKGDVHGDRIGEVGLVDGNGGVDRGFDRRGLRIAGDGVVVSGNDGQATRRRAGGEAVHTRPIAIIAAIAAVHFPVVSRGRVERNGGRAGIGGGRRVEHDARAAGRGAGRCRQIRGVGGDNDSVAGHAVDSGPTESGRRGLVGGGIGGSGESWRRGGGGGHGDHLAVGIIVLEAFGNCISGVSGDLDRVRAGSE